MNAYIYTAIAFIVAFVFTLVGVPKVITMCVKLKLYDQPNSRSVHKIAVPRLGGTLFFPATLLGMTAGFWGLYGGLSQEITLNVSTLGMGVGAILIYLIGIFDDIRGMKATHKFAVQAVAAAVFPFCNLLINDLHGFLGIHELPLFVSYPLTVFVILLIVNSMNLIDGIDGLSSCLAISILCIFSYLYLQLHANTFAVLGMALCGAVAAFAVYNVFGKVGKNKTFMGDSGSLFIGYVVAYLAIKFQMSNFEVLPYREDSLLISITMVLIPTFDVIRVALGRKFAGKPMFAPDKTHIHHRIMSMGLTQHETLGVILVLFACFCFINFGLSNAGVGITWIVLLDILIYLSFFFCIGKKGK